MTQDIDIFDDLKQRLICGSFPETSRLKAEDLRKLYGCSASTVRETLFRLSTIGLVDFQEQRGFRVPERTHDRRNDITQMRIMLESEGACRSIDLGGVDWESRLSAAHHRLSHIERRLSGIGEVNELPVLWMTAELEFHQTLISACGSALLQQMHLMLYYQFRQQMIDVDRSLSEISLNISQHEAILEAAIASDKTQMKDAIRAHFSRHLSPAPQA